LSSRDTGIRTRIASVQRRDQGTALRILAFQSEGIVISETVPCPPTLMSGLQGYYKEKMGRYVFRAAPENT